MATKGDRAYGLQPEQADWNTTHQQIGLGHCKPHITSALQAQRVAGMTSAECGYHNAANDFPRFERQKVRAIFDDGIFNGSKRPHPEMLRRFPNRERHGDETPSVQSYRPPSGRSGRSGRSVRSDRSTGSLRSAANSIAGSSASSVPPPGYFRQPLERGLAGCTRMYQTSSAVYGAGGHVAKEPVPGREAWMLGRGGGQQSSFDNCLLHKGRHIPEIIDK